MNGGSWKARRLAAIVGFLTAFAIPTQPTTAYDAQVFKGPRVATGQSLFGVTWNVYAGSTGGGYAFFFDMEPPAYHDVGFFAGVDRPVPDGFAFLGVAGSQLSPRPESDVSGITRRKVATILIEFRDGTSVEAPTIKPRRYAISKEPWLKRFRVFDVFFESAKNPVKVSAFDDEGVLLAESERGRGPYEGEFLESGPAGPALNLGP